MAIVALALALAAAALVPVAQAGPTTTPGVLEAERQFRKIIGYRDLAKVALADERELHRHPIQEVAVTLA